MSLFHSHFSKPVKLCLFIMCVFSIGSSFAERYLEEGYSLLSDDELEHLKIKGSLSIKKDWTKLTNIRITTCKYLHEGITTSEFEKTFGLSISKLSKDGVERFGPDSVWLESCNAYFPYYYKMPWEEDPNTYLDWKETDAYIDTPHSLVLVDQQPGQDEMKVLYIYKEYQLVANKDAKTSLLNRLFDVLLIQM